MKHNPHSNPYPRNSNVRLNFEDRVGVHLDIKSSQSEPGHVINTALAVSVDKMLKRWESEVIATDAYTDHNGALRSGMRCFSEEGASSVQTPAMWIGGAMF